MALSKSWQNFLVDSLKGLGAVDVTTGAELAVNEIPQKLDLEDYSQVRQSLRLAVTGQVRNDIQSQNNIFLNSSAYERASVTKLLTDNQILDQVVYADPQGKNVTLADALIEKMVTNTELAVDTLASGMVSGIADKQGMDDFTATEGTTYWTSIIDADYNTYLQQQNLTAKDLSREQFKELQTQSSILDNLTQLLGGDQQRALQILNQPLAEDDNVFKSNAGLLKEVTNFNANRQNRNYNPQGLNFTNDQSIRVIDVLSAMSKSVSRAQVLAFCDNRALEQNKTDANGNYLKKDDSTRLENNLGKSGRKEIEKTIDHPLSSNLAYPIQSKGSKASYPIQWKGYAKLASLISGWLGKIFGSIQTIGYVIRMSGKKAVATANHYEHQSNGDEPREWEMPNYLAMPDAFRSAPDKLNEAGEFFTKLQARLTHDKVKVTEYQTILAQQPKSKQNKDDIAILNYFQARVVEGEKNLNKMQIDLVGDQTLLHDKNYFDTLETNIINLNDYGNYQNIQDLKKKANISQMMTDAKNDTAEMYYAEALKTFDKARDPQATPAEKQSSHAMLATILELDDRYGKDITAQDMQDIAQTRMTPVTVEKYVDSLEKKPNHKPLSADLFREKAHASACEFLQEQKYGKEYTSQQITNDAIDLMQR